MIMARTPSSLKCSTLTPKLSTLNRAPGAFQPSTAPLAPPPMPTIHIPDRRLRTELLALLVCFIIANALNVYAIIHYESPAIELVSSILYVLMATAVLYAVWVIVRLLVYGFLCLIGRKPKRNNRRKGHQLYRSY